MNASTATSNARTSPAPTVTHREAREAIARAQTCGFNVEVEHDNWLVLSRNDFTKPMTVDMQNPTWIDDLRALLGAVTLIELAQHDSLSHRHAAPFKRSLAADLH